jgi:hypothetical protein
MAQERGTIGVVVIDDVSTRRVKKLVAWAERADSREAAR